MFGVNAMFFTFFVFVVAVVASSFLVDVIHNDTGDRCIDFLERIADGIENVPGSVGIFSDDEDLIDKGGEHDGVGNAVTRGAIEDDDVIEFAEFLNKSFVFVGAQEFAWVGRVSTASDNL